MTHHKAAGADPPGQAPVDELRLTIRQETRVGWFAVRQLAATAAKVLTSTIVGSMAGRRELMAALDPRPAGNAACDHDYSKQPEIWIDYIADTGDGFDATHSIAWLVGRDGLLLKKDASPTEQPVPSQNPEAGPPAAGGDEVLLPPGDILILGGDEVYPTASGEAYQGRLLDPFQSARFYQEPGRDVYAIPGNHDWYDGLTAFIRLFCQTGARWVGAWQTQQRRSYFALRLPHGWWLWGVDMALEDDLDPPQVSYFRTQSKSLSPGDKVILCIPSPTWIKHGAPASSVAARAKVRDRTVQREIDRFEFIAKLITDAGARIPLALSGDLHHYTRHASSETNYIVCGGGGAFALGTRRTPEYVALGARPAKLEKAFPDQRQSDDRRWWALAFPLLSPGFTVGLTLFQLLICYALNLASRLNPDAPRPERGWIAFLQATPFSVRGMGDVLADLYGFLGAAPISLLLLAAYLGALLAFARSGTDEDGSALCWVTAGCLHWLLQVTLGIVLTYVATQVVAPNGLVSGLAFVALLGLALFLLGGLLFGAYLLVGNIVCALHEQEVFSCQAIEQYKCFLRINLDGHGLTIYPIGLENIVKRWKPAPRVTRTARRVVSLDLSCEEKLVVPAHASRIYDPIERLRPQLLDGPIKVR